MANGDHKFYKEFLEQGTYERHTPQKIYASLLPKRDMMPEKFNITIVSDREMSAGEPVSFRCQNPVKLMFLIIHLSEIYFEMNRELRKISYQQFYDLVDQLTGRIKNIGYSGIRPEARR